MIKIQSLLFDLHYFYLCVCLVPSEFGLLQRLFNVGFCQFANNITQYSLNPFPFHVSSIRVLYTANSVPKQPKKYFTSLSKLPSQTHPLFQIYLPLPCFLSFEQNPVYISGGQPDDIHFPYQCLQPSLKEPMQDDLSAQTYFPWPLNLSRLYSPQYLSPFEKSQWPKLFLQFYLKLPQQMLFSYYRQPFPSILFALQPPSQQLLSSLSKYFPLPCFSPSMNSPSQQLPFGVIKRPFPYRFPLENCPLQQYLFLRYSMPSPDFQFFSESHSPMQILPAKCQTTRKVELSGNQNIIQFLYFFSEHPTSSFSLQVSSERGKILRIKFMISSVEASRDGGLGKQGISGAFISMFRLIFPFLSAESMREIIFGFKNSASGLWDCKNYKDQQIGFTMFLTMVPQNWLFSLHYLELILLLVKS